jgi:hypothetical protein
MCGHLVSVRRDHPTLFRKSGQGNARAVASRPSVLGVSLCHWIHGKRIPQTARGAGRAPAGRPLETVRRVLGQASRLPYSVQLYRASVSVPTTLYPTPPVRGVFDRARLNQLNQPVAISPVDLKKLT